MGETTADSEAGLIVVIFHHVLGSLSTNHICQTRKQNQLKGSQLSSVQKLKVNRGKKAHRNFINKGLNSLLDTRYLGFISSEETQVQSLGRDNPLEKEMAAHSNILAWKISWTEESTG